MRALLQRVDKADVKVSGKTVGAIEKGLLVLLGVFGDDTERDAQRLAEKSVNLRIFDDENGTMNRSLLEAGGSLLVVSQFTLCADTRKGRRPSWHLAARSEFAKRMYEKFIEEAKKLGVKTETGVFQAEMKVSLCNDGPVTIILDSREWA